MPNANKKTSLKDIAEAVGVSTALVSYVLNNKKEGRISKTVAEKIRETARAMNYRINQIARSLKTSKTFTIGLVLADISNPFSSALARAIEDGANRNNYTVIFGSSDENPEKFKTVTEALLNRQVDGLIIAAASGAEPIIDELLQQQLPFILIDRYYPSKPTSYVVLDNYKAACNATEYLIKCRHNNIGMINYGPALFNLSERSRGYLDALAVNGLDYADKYLQQAGVNDIKTETEAAVDKLLFEDTQPADAILFGSNVIAGHAVRYINSKGLVIPKDLSLICFDETDIFDFFYAPLTCIRQPVKEMGELAVQFLLEQIDNKDTGLKQASLPGQLIIRQSTRNTQFD